MPFIYPIHDAPDDKYRFTEYGIRYILKEGYKILNLTSVDDAIPRFPAAYCVKARKLGD